MTRLDWNPAALARRRERLAQAQTRLEETALEACRPYVPVKTGALAASGKREPGKLLWTVDYARHRYYSTARSEKAGNGLRGGRWFHRMKAQRLEEIVREVKAHV